jgi:integrase
VVKSAGIEDLRFHDLRREAVSRLFELGLNPMEAAAITGLKTLQMLKRYTHLRAADLVLKTG